MKHEELRDALLSFPEMVKDHPEHECYSILDAHLRDFTAERATLSQSEDCAEMEQFRALVLPVVLTSALCRYIFEKPRGYPGDFVTQEMIWKGRTLGGMSRYSGTTEAGKLLNSLILDTENCRANETRIRFFRTLVQSRSSIASIGSGCGIEFWECTNGTADILLLDQDQGALDRAQEKIGNRKSLALHCQNILKFVLGCPKGSAQERRELVYAAGLLDYFDMKSSRRIAAGLWSIVAPGGELVLTNAEPSNPTRLWMEYGGDWFLHYKTREEIMQLAEGLPAVNTCDVSIDDFGVYQYLRIRKQE